MNVAIINCFDTYEHRVDLLHSYFKNNGDIVKVYTSNYRHIEKIIRTDKKEDYIFFEAIKYKKNMSVSRLLSHILLSKKIFKEVRKQNVDLLWVLVPPNTFVKDAAKCKIENSNVKLIFDVIDMWPETMPVKKIENLFPIKIWRNLRDKWIKYADYVVTECDLYQEKLKEIIDNDKMKTIYLSRDIDEFDSNPKMSLDRISLCYLGSINNIIDISAIVNIINEIKQIKPVELHIIGDGENKEELIKLSKQAGANVIYHGKIYNKKEKQEIFDYCHYGLNIMKDSVFVGLTMKSIDYFEAGLPIINNIHGDTWKLVNEKNIGFNVDNLNFNDLNNSNFIQRHNARSFMENYLNTETFFESVKGVLIKVYK